MAYICDQLCTWNDPSDGCVKPWYETCPMSNVAAERKPMTNADRIRAMSDEELAEKLYRDVIGVVCQGKRERNEPCSEYGCKDCMLEWLQQPVKED